MVAVTPRPFTGTKRKPPCLPQRVLIIGGPYLPQHGAFGYSNTGAVAPSGYVEVSTYVPWEGTAVVSVQLALRPDEIIPCEPEWSHV
jgi:hypothetical protein